MRYHLPFAAFLLIALPPTVSAAQIFSSSAGREPRWWFSASTGFLITDYVVDDATQSAWDFDAAMPFRASAERSIRRGLAVGTSLTWARAPLRYASTATNSACPGSCAADATVTSYGVTARMTGGGTLHQVLQVTVGATRYGNFQTVNGSVRLPPKSNTDFSFGAGYGVGYSISGDWQVQLMQDAMYVLHERSEAGGRLRRNYLTSLGLRVGL